jgi:hypothetical protein
LKGFVLAPTGDLFDVCAGASADREALKSHGKTQHSNYLERSDATSAVRKQTERPSIVHSSRYLPEPVCEALRRIAFEERLKIHDVVLEGIDAALRRRGYPSIGYLKGGKKR